MKNLKQLRIEYLADDTGGEIAMGKWTVDEVLLWMDNNDTKTLQDKAELQCPRCHTYCHGDCRF